MNKHMSIYEDLVQTLPFGVFDDDEEPNLICRFSHEEDAEAYLVYCNNHDALVKALSDIMSAKWRPEGMSEELADAARAALTAAGAA